MKKEVLRIENIIGDEESITNLNNMSMRVKRGEIYGIVPINGHGCENLLNLLNRNEPIHFGRVYINEKLVNSYYHSDMSLNCVYIIERRSKLIAELTILDNIFMPSQKPRKLFFDRRNLLRQFKWMVEELHLDEMEISFGASTRVESLSVFEKCVVELLKGIAKNAVIIVINGISDIISAANLHRIHYMMDILSKKGVSFLYVCSNYKEVIAVSDRTLFMQDGRDLKEFERSEYHSESFHKLIALLTAEQTPAEKRDRQTLFSVEGFCAGSIRDLSFCVKAGECLVFYDEMRIVQEDFFYRLSQGQIEFSAKVFLNSKWMSARALRRSLGSQIAVIAAHPLTQMVYPDLSYLENLCLNIGKKNARRFVSKKISNNVRQEFAELIGVDIDAASINGLSNESLYHLVYYRMLLLKPKIVLIEHPFMNADISLHKHIVKLIKMLTASGIGVIILATDLSVSNLVADRMIILRGNVIRR